MQQFSGLSYLKIDIANSFGQDKLSWNDRISWFDDNIGKMSASEASEPCMAYAGLSAYADVIRGKPIGYPISLDATCSGMAWLSILAHDEGGAKLTNIIDTGNRVDAYTEVFNAVKAKLPSLESVTRKEAKAAVMTSLYGSEVEPEKIFGADVGAFYRTMYELMPKTWALNKYMLDIWNPNATHHEWVMPDGFDVYTPIYVNKEESFSFLGSEYKFIRKEIGTKKKGRSLGANLAHSTDSFAVREVVRRCNYDVKHIRVCMETLAGETGHRATQESYKLAERLSALYKLTGYLSARVLECYTYNTKWMFPEKEMIKLLKSLPNKPFKVLTIHDAFRVLPNYGNDLRKQYKEVCVGVAKSNLLNHILSTMAPGSSVKIGETITSKIGCDYALT